MINGEKLAYQQGYEGYNEGEDNPYDAESQDRLYHAWGEGYDAAEADEGEEDEDEGEDEE